jgi:hypothetical protein
MMYLTDNGKFSQQPRQIRTDHEQLIIHYKHGGMWIGMVRHSGLIQKYMNII